MRIAVITNEDLKAELLARGLQEGLDIEWMSTPVSKGYFDACIDLLFDASPDHLAALAQMQTALYLLNDVCKSEISLPGTIVRFNGWKTCLGRSVMELAAANEETMFITAKILAYFNRNAEWVPDQPGFVTARVISMIINEAYLALEAGVSTKEDIDIAMQSGTSYPYGPFAWSQLIGTRQIEKLLLKLSATSNRYQPSRLLQQEAASK
jgi:3-hydroxybutyryl-CoA dehydrogenase